MTEIIILPTHGEIMLNVSVCNEELLLESNSNPSSYESLSGTKMCINCFSYCNVLVDTLPQYFFTSLFLGNK
jgi:hypothetical protein